MNDKLINALQASKIDIKQIESLFHENPNININAYDEHGRTYLHFCFYKKIEFFDCLI